MRKVSSTAYVDDVNTQHKSLPGEPEELINSMKKDFNRWRGI